MLVLIIHMILIKIFSLVLNPLHHGLWTVITIGKHRLALPDDASDDKRYSWDEDVYQADNSKGWVVVE